MQLNKDSTIDTIQNYIDTKTEFIKNQWNLSLGAYKNLDIESFSGQLDVQDEWMNEWGDNLEKYTLGIESGIDSTNFFMEKYFTEPKSWISFFDVLRIFLFFL